MTAYYQLQNLSIKLPLSLSMHEVHLLGYIVITQFLPELPVVHTCHLATLNAFLVENITSFLYSLFRAFTVLDDIPKEF